MIAPKATRTTKTRLMPTLWQIDARTWPPVSGNDVRTSPSRTQRIPSFGTSSSWRDFVPFIGVKTVEIDQCAFGCQHKKPTIMLTNAPWMNTAKCEDAPPHSHVPLQGKVWSYKANLLAAVFLARCQLAHGTVEDPATTLRCSCIPLNLPNR